jgi:ferric-dicitrate binding protein FerR (iron transport regulator)
MKKDLLEKFLHNKATAEEMADFLTWIQSEAADNEVEEYLIEAFSRHNVVSYLWQDEQVLQQLKQKIAKLQERSTMDKGSVPKGEEQHASMVLLADPHERKISVKKYMGVLKVAASLVLVAALVFLFREQAIKDNAPADSVQASNHFVIKSTERGQKLSFFLDDGTRVMLNSSSELRYSRFEEGGVRNVTLKGEAFFEVVKDENRPFVVHSSGYNTIVHGTSFVVRSSDERNQLTVALKTGSVSVEKDQQASAEDERIMLKPGEKVLIDLERNSGEIGLINEFESFGWTEGILYFSESPFEEVLRKLERWYDVDITLDNRKKIVKRYSATYTNESLENVLRGLSFVNDFDYEINGKNVKIKLK